MDLQSWAENLNKDVYQKWKTDFEYHSPGFKIFSTPVRENPPFLILGYNPGGDAKSFKKDKERFQEGDFSVPKKNELDSNEYDFGEEIEKLFKEEEELLSNSVALDLIFFRSRNMKELRKGFGEDYNDAKQFSYNKVEEVLDKINPESILIVGKETYKKFKKNIQNKTETVPEETVTIDGQKVFMKYKWNGKPLFVVIHPTGQFTRHKFTEKVKKMREKMLDAVKS